jgi:hypothetical protein
MSDLVLAAAGAIIFLLTAWASLVFGYQVFQNMWDADQVDGAAHSHPPVEDRAVPLLAVDATDGEGARSNGFVQPAAPAA